MALSRETKKIKKNMYHEMIKISGIGTDMGDCSKTLSVRTHSLYPQQNFLAKGPNSR
jgi:hypothetical protein